MQGYIISEHENLLKEFNDLLVKRNADTTAQDMARLEAFKKMQTDTVNQIQAPRRPMPPRRLEEAGRV